MIALENAERLAVDVNTAGGFDRLPALGAENIHPPSIDQAEPVLKALTIKQPWAWAIAAGFKRVENRTWPTRYRGWLAIHAAVKRGWHRDGDRRLAELGHPVPARGDLVYSAIIAVARVVDCVRVEDLPAPDPLAVGPWCWLLDDIRPVDSPVACSGRLSLWSVPAAQAERLRLQLA